MSTIDLNADVGEGAPHDAELIPLVTSANIACGGHAGDESTMEAAARIAIDHGVAIGAHPGHEDREHFGRRELSITPIELRNLLERQVNRLHSIVCGLGGEVRYVKLHGALYHQAGREESLAEAVIDFVNGFHVPLALLGQAGTPLETWAVACGIEFAREAFADRAYMPDGTLAPRSAPDALLTDPKAVANQAFELVEIGEPRVRDDGACYIECDSLCLHGDEAGVVERASAIRNRLRAEGMPLRAFTT